LLGDVAVGHFDQAVMHVPVETVERAMADVRRLGADSTVALGGGSTTGLGKALVLRAGLPNIAIPTTFAGSEMTNIWGITENARKTTGRNVRVVPQLTIYDPEMIRSLPAHIAGPSGLNAMAQAVVNVASADPNPIVSMMGVEAVRALSRALPLVVAKPEDLEARTLAMYGACLAGATLGTGITGLHHRLCHVLGGSFNTPHAETHTILLPHTVAYNAAATREGTARVAEAMGVANAALGIFHLAGIVGAPRALADIGFREADLDKAVAIAMETPLNNPEPVTAEKLRALLENAYHGYPPRAV
jgi:maleylacetate reductase